MVATIPPPKVGALPANEMTTLLMGTEKVFPKFPREETTKLALRRRTLWALIHSKKVAYL